MYRIILMLTLGLLCAAGQASDNTLVFKSEQQRVNLLELYTSEGCSSCPPAEAWLANLLDHPQLWEQLVPVVFHVDYWNHLGWNDPFSNSGNSARQRQHKEQGGIRSVYTPGFVLNGGEWRGWFSRDSLPLVAEETGVLKAELTGDKLEVSYEPIETSSPTLELQVAVLGFDLVTHVPKGENRGKALSHQFTVLAHAMEGTKNNRWKLDLPVAIVPTGRRALAVWVTKRGRLQPLQATGGWLP